MYINTYINKSILYHFDTWAWNLRIPHCVGLSIIKMKGLSDGLRVSDSPFLMGETSRKCWIWQFFLTDLAKNSWLTWSMWLKHSTFCLTKETKNGSRRKHQICGLIRKQCSSNWYKNKKKCHSSIMFSTWFSIVWGLTGTILII